MILVVGGAGYIGSQVVRELLNQKYEVLVLDNLLTGRRVEVDFRAQFIEGNFGDRELLQEIFSEKSIDAVMHVAPISLVEKTVDHTAKNYQNNVSAINTLLETMLEFSVKKFIVTLNQDIHKIPNDDLIIENNSGRQLNSMIEIILEDYHKVYDLEYAILRYMNNGDVQTVLEYDYSSADGTCINGDINETYLVQALFLSVEKMLEKNSFINA
ncbi:NAD-dependent epimerase/dehydratase family protein [Gottfriedia acidiceleris]|uniref:NAD-dependent epimerase/dehydratase family protein n=1 Tax=Gottfriedia acidiceleris TaxID=371036 RepID=UPI00339253BF